MKHVVLVSKIENGFEVVGYHGPSNYKDGAKSFVPIKFFSLSVAALPCLSGSGNRP